MSRAAGCFVVLSLLGVVACATDSNDASSTPAATLFAVEPASSNGSVATALQQPEPAPTAIAVTPGGDPWVRTAELLPALDVGVSFLCGPIDLTDPHNAQLLPTFDGPLPSQVLSGVGVPFAYVGWLDDVDLRIVHESSEETRLIGLDSDTGQFAYVHLGNSDMGLVGHDWGYCRFEPRLVGHDAAEIVEISDSGTGVATVLARELRCASGQLPGRDRPIVAAEIAAEGARYLAVFLEERTAVEGQSFTCQANPVFEIMVRYDPASDLPLEPHPEI